MALKILRRFFLMWVRLPPWAPLFPAKLKEFPSHHSQCTPGVPHPAKVRVAPDSTHAPNRLPIVPVATVPTVRSVSRVIRTLWWPSRIETRSIGTPAKINSTASVSRKRCACGGGNTSTAKSMNLNFCGSLAKKTEPSCGQCRRGEKRSALPLYERAGQLLSVWRPRLRYSMP